MPLFNIPQQQYYDNSQTLVSNGNAALPPLLFDPLPTSEADFDLFVAGNEIAGNLYAYNASNGVITMDTALATGTQVIVRQIAQNEQLGNYQYIGIDDLIANFQVNYVGEDKIIRKVKVPEISFHVQRAIAELSYDTLRSEKTQEIEIPPSLSMRLPHDYVNYVKLSWKDDAGIERVIYPARKTSNPKALLQDDSFDYTFDQDGTLLEALESNTWTDFQNSASIDNNVENVSGPDVDATLAEGRRYGLQPENAQFNGLYFIDNSRGYIYFSSGINGKTVTLKYISDSLGTEDEIRVHKFAEEAVYKWTAHGILSSRVNTPEYIIARFKKERFASARKAKLRLSNLKAEELNLIMKNKSKQIKH
tara:strand:- start:275 stop:1363 length:1089 start_codon:yes stop_codon:yes gene_type:complete